MNEYYAEKGMTDKLAGFKWEYNLVDDNQVNAWCMPGGKIVVYIGLLHITQNEAALAGYNPQEAINLWERMEKPVMDRNHLNFSALTLQKAGE